MTTTSATKVWVCRAGQNEFGHDFLKRRIVAVSNCEPQHDYRSVEGMGIEELKAMLDEFYPQLSKSDKSRRARELFEFANSDDEQDGLCVGDLVLVPLDAASVAYTVVSGPYRFNKDDPIASPTGVLPHERPVCQRVGSRSRKDFPPGTFVRSRFYRPKSEGALLRGYQNFIVSAMADEGLA